jgi:hypothetical protein
MNNVFVCRYHDLTFWFFVFKVKEQQKKALDEYPTTFDYDGVYDKMKEKVARPLIQDHEERDMAAALSILLKISINHFIMFIAQCSIKDNLCQVS